MSNFLFMLGIVTLPGFLYFWGLVFLATTTVVGVFKKEVEYHVKNHQIVHDRNIKTAYTSLKKILELKPVQIFVLILLTCKVCFTYYICFTML